MTIDEKNVITEAIGAIRDAALTCARATHKLDEKVTICISQNEDPQTHWVPPVEELHKYQSCGCHLLRTINRGDLIVLGALRDAMYDAERMYIEALNAIQR